MELQYKEQMAQTAERWEAFWAGEVLDRPLVEFAGNVVRMDRRQRRAYVITSLGGRPQRIRFGVVPVDGDAQ